ncbi:MAG: fumarylacetoacetate hydrolase family protein [Verrucomicrobia bacterium]|nr:fumarylacetoacetate hydrolase family protein [Verrucomicrobiota bacterium]
MRVFAFTDPATGERVAAAQDAAGVWREAIIKTGRFALTERVVDHRHPAPGAPFTPRAIFCAGVNYADHAKEFGSQQQAHPTIFMKNPASATGSGSVLLPRFLRSDAVDYEAELAVVIGRDCHNVTPAQALDYVLAYTCANDVSARDWQKEWGGGQWCRGKSFDTFCPLGPCLVTPDEIPDPQQLQVSFRLNGTTMQSAATATMQFSVADLIAFLAASSTLPAGSVILTGTPAGVGMAQKPPRWLQPGDVMEVEISGIGVLRNEVGEEA